jgi:hypothetical protein
MFYEFTDGSTSTQDVTSQVGYNGQTPFSTFNHIDNAYDVPLYIGTTPLVYKDGTPVTVLAMIGVKGDANLNNVVDAVDASSVLTNYSLTQIGTSTKLFTGTSDALKKLLDKYQSYITFSDGFDVYNELASFLADVDTDEYSEGNWHALASGRRLDAVDSSSIVTFYSLVQTGSPDNSATWDKVLGRKSTNA